MREWKHGIAVVPKDNDVESEYEVIAIIGNRKVYHIVLYENELAETDWAHLRQELTEDPSIRMDFDFDLVDAPGELVEVFAPLYAESYRELEDE